MLHFAGKGMYCGPTVGLSALMLKIKASIGRSISANIALQSNLQKDLPVMRGEPALIEQIMNALVLNAAESIGGNLGLITIQRCCRTWMSHSPGKIGSRAN